MPDDEGRVDLRRRRDRAHRGARVSALGEELRCGLADPLARAGTRLDGRYFFSGSSGSPFSVAPGDGAAGGAGVSAGVAGGGVHCAVVCAIF